jgi:hypothetical protein
MRCCHLSPRNRFKKNADTQSSAIARERQEIHAAANDLARERAELLAERVAFNEARESLEAEVSQ